MEADRLVLCRWDGKTFTTQHTGVRVSGEPRAICDLRGNNRYRVIALEGASAVWVSDPLMLEPR